MTEADRALVLERDECARSALRWSEEHYRMSMRWRHAGRTIRRYRDWWVQAEREASAFAAHVEKLATELLEYRAERDKAMIAQMEWLKRANELEKERDSARAALADAKAEGAHEVLGEMAAWTGINNADLRDKLRARYPRKEAK